MKNVIITGANGNLGSAVTAEFLKNEYNVIVTVAKESMQKDFEANKNLKVHVVDLMHEDESRKFVEETIKTYGKIDAALLLVGGFAAGDISKTSISDVHAQIALNFDTAYHIAKPVFTHMIEKGQGRIVFVGSRPALEASAGKNLIAYGLSKSLLFKLADYMNAEAKGKNVVTTVVVPSTIDTRPNRQSMPDADPEKWVKPSALADVLEFVVSDRSAPLRETILKVYNNA
jgi:NAD(P)-dependent dehydrogenase (short-subunit alcohol dehydrogenase family)